jgi:hypothetical protein
MELTNTLISSSRMHDMMSPTSKRFFPILFPAMFLLASGCGGGGGDRGAVSGMVKLDGKPIEQGSILFTPVQGVHGSVTGGEIENGRYELTGKNGPALGRNRVEIRAMRKTGKMVQKPFAPAGTLVPEKVEAVSPRFNTNTTLTVEIQEGDNTADFEVSAR